MTTNSTNSELRRATGLLVIEVVNSNPNGDPDNESEPRTRVGDRGEISPVSFKRKLRDLVEQKDGPVWRDVADQFEPRLADDDFGVLESENKNKRMNDIRAEIDNGSFVRRYWDARLFGNTFLQEKKSTEHVSTGVVQFGLGVSVAPVEIQRHTLTNKGGVQEGKKGMAPLGYRVVQHGVYCMPFFVNPSAAPKSGCTRTDLDLMLRLLPYAYTHTASFVRPDVRIRHAWYIEHKTRLGSCPDSMLIDSLTPVKKGDKGAASLEWCDYEVPAGLSDDLRNRISSCIDLADHDWKTAGA